VEVTKNPNAEIAYTWYEEDIVQRYNVVMEGWRGPFQNPSTLSTSLPALRELLDAIKTGEAGFRKLLPAEAAERRKKWDTDVAAGHAVVKHRAERSDKGKPRKRARDDDNEDADGREGQVDTDGTRDGNINDGASAAPPKKRSRKTTSITKPAKASKTAAPKPRAKRAAPRDDEITRGAAQRLANNARIKSCAIITSDDERDDDPDADLPTVPTTTST
jgi:hypothetical protein